MTYTLTLDGRALHYYPDLKSRGWGPTSSLTGTPGQPITWSNRKDAERWATVERVFCAGAVITELEPERIEEPAR